MSRRIALWLGCAIALLVVGAMLGYWFMQPHPRIDEETLAKITSGMTEDEVIAIIGAPPGNYGYGEPIYDWSGPGQQTKHWWGRDAAILVTFDEHGGVQGAYYFAINREYDSFLHRVGVWLGVQKRNGPRADVLDVF
jgi:hypothetical protein